MKLVVVDNYDSFTHNLVDLLERLGARCDVVMHDEVDLDALSARRPDGFVISPGPCTPAESGVSLALATAAVRGELGVPLLGVCLGHQAIAVALGAKLVRAEHPLHGKTSSILHQGTDLFVGLPQGFEAARYNSLLVDPASLADDLEVTARTESGELMALRHVRLPVFGVQFHPESFLSPRGADLARNFLGMCTQRTESAA
ncbi:MAG: aminodeoxychorismate/anthranilate synthase component II [Polyangiaceae bacterium]|nr:aminodeoxychorismate/anthranilate synthase component II [Polyangiaceae bacterium]